MEENNTTSTGTTTRPPLPTVQHVADISEESLLKIAALAAEHGDTTIRIRCLFQLFDGEQYQAWRGEVWKVEVGGEDRGVAEARQVQKAVDQVFDLISRVGAAGALAKLEGLS